jgi:hypothetical protein
MSHQRRIDPLKMVKLLKDHGKALASFSVPVKDTVDGRINVDTELLQIHRDGRRKHQARFDPGTEVTASDLSRLFSNDTNNDDNNDLSRIETMEPSEPMETEEKEEVKRGYFTNHACSEYNYHKCHTNFPGQWYTCGYLVVKHPHTGQRLIEDTRIPTECIANIWLTTGISPHSGYPIIDVQFDSPTHPCQWGLAPGVIETKDNTDETDKSGKNGKSGKGDRRIGRSELVSILLADIPREEHKRQREYLATLDNTIICVRVRQKMAFNYAQLRKEIQEWSHVVSNSIHDSEMMEVATLLGIRVDSIENIRNSQAERKRIATEMLTRIMNFQPKGFAAWSNWFKEIITRGVKGGTDLSINFLSKYKAQSALVILTALYLVADPDGSIMMNIYDVGMGISAQVASNDIVKSALPAFSAVKLAYDNFDTVNSVIQAPTQIRQFFSSKDSEDNVGNFIKDDDNSDDESNHVKQVKGRSKSSNNHSGGRSRSNSITRSNTERNHSQTRSNSIKHRSKSGGQKRSSFSHGSVDTRQTHDKPQTRSSSYSTRTRSH